MRMIAQRTEYVNLNTVHFSDGVIKCCYHIQVTCCGVSWFELVIDTGKAYHYNVSKH